ncbi:multiheme c-type cytochrome [Salegentibacter sediminis]|uniref:multiheme c-type cytochrome n=1 Tax=Salegentibacter sediminis TaxID=1930251 RepID=UPI0009BC9533|nr:multiheme c-type cytochrome [Salegentibacter sediminis]
MHTSALYLVSSRIFNIYLVLLILVFFIGCNHNDEKEAYLTIEKSGEISSQSGTFIGSKACAACHQEEYAEWQESHHYQAMQIANSNTVLGNFEDQHFKHKDKLTKFFKRKDKFFVNTEGSNGENQNFEILYTFGVYPLQQYIVKFPDGAYQCLPVAWDAEKSKWFHLQPDLDIKHDEWMHWTGGSMNWNSMCADCHSTDLEKNFNPDQKIYNTHYSEINVSCEACHGPAGQHVGYYQKGGNHGESNTLYIGNDLSSTELVDKCARCHSRRTQITEKFNYKGKIFDHYEPHLLTDPEYEIDGQIDDEDYVYGSFVQSKMYQHGVSCADCHNVHTTKLKKTGNKLCLSCHSTDYNAPSHHMHQENSVGSSCIDCHMAGKTYMGNDFRRDHSFRIPRPDQSMIYGTPNACNQCHEDKTPQWASEVIVKKFGKERADHFSDHLLPGSLGDIKPLYLLLENDSYPEIVRATAVRRLSDHILDEEGRDLVFNLLQDSSALVRNEAIKLSTLQGDIGISGYIESLLNDSSRMVRISAANYFIRNQKEPSSQSFEKAEEEFLNSLKMNSDFASGQVQQALYYEAKGEINLAKKAYERALQIDRHYNVARMNLALLSFNQGDIRIAESLYLKVTELEPEYADSYFMLGLLYNEMEEEKKSLFYLSEACQRNNLRACYNYALKLQENKEFNKSLEVLKKRLKTNPHNENLHYVKLIGELKTGKKDSALNTINKLLKISPNNSTYRDILKSLKK